MGNANFYVSHCALCVYRLNNRTGEEEREKEKEKKKLIPLCSFALCFSVPAKKSCRLCSIHYTAKLCVCVRVCACVRVSEKERERERQRKERGPIAPSLFLPPSFSSFSSRRNAHRTQTHPSILFDSHSVKRARKERKERREEWRRKRQRCHVCPFRFSSSRSSHPPLSLSLSLLPRRWPSSPSLPLASYHAQPSPRFTAALHAAAFHRRLSFLKSGRVPRKGALPPENRRCSCSRQPGLALPLFLHLGLAPPSDLPFPAASLAPSPSLCLHLFPLLRSRALALFISPPPSSDSGRTLRLEGSTLRRSCPCHLCHRRQPSSPAPLLVTLCISESTA